MDWGKWIDKLLVDLGLVAIPVLMAAFAAMQEDPAAPLWATIIIGAILVALRRLSNYLKHRNDPPPATASG